LKSASSYSCGSISASISTSSREDDEGHAGEHPDPDLRAFPRRALVDEPEQRRRQHDPGGEPPQRHVAAVADRVEKKKGRAPIPVASAVMSPRNEDERERASSATIRSAVRSAGT